MNNNSVIIAGNGAQMQIKEINQCSTEQAEHLGVTDGTDGPDGSGA